MRRSNVRAMVTGAVIALASAADLSAQGTTIQFTGRPGTVVRTITSSRGSMVFHEVNEAGQRIGDSVMGEMTSLAGVTRRVLEERGGNRVLDVQYDSLKTRARLAGQAWKEDILSGAGVVLRVTVDGRLRAVDGSATGLQTDPVASGGIASWRGVELPDRPVAPGESWTMLGVYRLPPQLGALLDISIRDSVEGSVTVRLDSVSLQGGDTLMYLNVQQRLGPVFLPAIDAGDSASVELVGSQAASLVWSTGWNAYVSGASQARLVGRLHSAGAGGTPRLAEITWSVSTRLQVRS